MTTPTKTKKTTIEKPIETLPTNPFVFEILELASKQRSNARKVEVLKTYEHDSLKSIFIWNFDETIVSLLPDVRFLMVMLMSNLYMQEVYQRILRKRLMVENLQQDKIWMEEEEHL